MSECESCESLSALMLSLEGRAVRAEAELARVRDGESPRIAFWKERWAENKARAEWLEAATERVRDLESRLASTTEALREIADMDSVTECGTVARDCLAQLEGEAR